MLMTTVTAGYPGWPPPTTVQRRAVIDIGTNSVKLLVADIEGKMVIPIYEHGEQTRLGLGFFDTNVLQPGPLVRTASVVGGYAKKAAEMGAVHTRIIATSAARDAVNREELRSLVFGTTGIPVEIITGELEAEYAFAGAVTSAAAALQGSTLILDLGGGSTEFVLGHGLNLKFRQSIRLGTVRLFEQHPPADPPKPENLVTFRAAIRALMDESLTPGLRHHLTPETRLIATGGTPAILARIQLELATWDRTRIESSRLSRSDVWNLRERLWGMSLSERLKLPGLPADRADVILAGVVIFETVMELFGFDTMAISTRGLRFGALLEST